MLYTGSLFKLPPGWLLDASAYDYANVFYGRYVFIADWSYLWLLLKLYKCWGFPIAWFVGT